jgi:hypothetical protein
MFNSRIFIAIRMSAKTCRHTPAEWALRSILGDFFETIIALHFVRWCNWRHGKAELK